MDETHSDLTKISTLSKKLRGPNDDITEVSDVSDDISRPLIVVEDLSNIPNKEDIENCHLKINIIEEFSVDKAEEEIMSSFIDNMVENYTISLDKTLYQSEVNKEQSRYDTEYVSETDTKEIIHAITKDLNILKVVETDALIAVNSISTIGEETHSQTRSSILPLASYTIDNDNEAASLEKENEVSSSEKENDELVELNKNIILQERYNLINKLKRELKESDILTEVNQCLEVKLVKYFKHRRPDAVKKIQKQLQVKESVIVDIDQRYDKYLMTVVSLQQKLQMEMSEIKDVNYAKLIKINEQDRVLSEVYKDFVRIQRSIGSTAANSNTGRRIPSEELETFYSLESKKDEIVHSVRLENIKLQNTCHTLNTRLFAKEGLKDKLNLVDFEQLKIENITFHSKLEERNDSIFRLTERVTKNAHKISHMKEKLQFAYNESQVEDIKQKEITIKFNVSRRKLAKQKNERDEILNINNRLIKSGGLLQHKNLLKHFQYTVDNIQNQRIRVETMSNDYNSIVIKRNEMKHKLKS